jgi:hypothetical protein
MAITVTGWAGLKKNPVANADIGKNGTPGGF